MKNHRIEDKSIIWETFAELFIDHRKFSKKIIIGNWTWLTNLILRLVDKNNTGNDQHLCWHTQLFSLYEDLNSSLTNWNIWKLQLDSFKLCIFHLLASWIPPWLTETFESFNLIASNSASSISWLVNQRGKQWSIKSCPQLKGEPPLKLRDLPNLVIVSRLESEGSSA